MMRRLVFVGVILGGLATCFLPLAVAAERENVAGDRFAPLILQLGSDRYIDREAAMRELDTMGREALPSLRRAAGNADAEIRRRAEELVEKIEKQIETARLLAPTRVRLVYKDRPLSEALNDFTHKSGLTIQIFRDPNRRRTSEPTITLDTGEVSLWEAFDQLCRKAGIVERDLLPGHRAGSSAAELNRTRREQEARLLLAQQQLMLEGSAEVRNSACIVVDGTFPPLAACQSTSLRIRTLPRGVHAVSLPTAKDEIHVVLETTPEPKLSFQRIIDARIATAVDNHGQELHSVPTPARTPNDYGGDLGAVVWMEDGRNRDLMPHFRQIPIRLKAGPQPSQSLRELSGVLLAQVQTPPQPLISVDNLFKATGHIAKGPDGTALKIVKVNQSTEGPIEVIVELECPLPPGNVRLGRGVPMARLVGGGRRIVDASGRIGPMDLTLHDAEGKNIPASRMVSQYTLRDNQMVQQFTMTYESRKAREKSAKLVYTGRRTMIIEVPFTLKDVPLP